MKKIFSISLLFILLFTPVLSLRCDAENIDIEIEQSYINSDFESSAKLLEQKISQFKGKLPAGRRSALQIYMNQLLLAHIYAWKLNKPEKSLEIYEELIQLNKTGKGKRKMPALEFLYTAELYAAKNNLQEAEKYYQMFMIDLSELKEREHDNLSSMFADELIKFTKYQIDGIRLKMGGEHRLKKLKLSSAMTPNMALIFSMALVPAARYETLVAMRTDLSTYIQQNTANISSMVIDYGLLLQATGGSVDKSSEKAMKAYLSKYPEGYFSLSLRYLFFKFYQESGQKKKADMLLAELDNIARKRGMELIVNPDKRFSSPEKTWETYKKALMAGDLDLALECHIPNNNKYRQIFKLMGKDKMKKMAEKMNPIGKITLDDMRAKYRITRNEKGNEITYYIYFSNINGEWKIVQY
jgi:tetratricopeptide (TPR) repeat protein